VADLRAPTPSAAAELVSRNQQELLQQLAYKQQRLEMALDRIFSQQQQRLQQLRLRLQNQHPQNQLLMQKAKTAQLHHRLLLAMQRQMEKTQQKLTALSARLKQNPLPYRLQKQSQYLLATLCGKLDGLSPLKVLARGYSIAEDAKGHAIVSVKQVKTGDTIKTKVADGEIISRVC